MTTDAAKPDASLPVPQNPPAHSLPPAPTAAVMLAAESRKKHHRINRFPWPRARLVLEILYHQIDRERTFTLVSALTYKTLFSLLPIFVLTLLILSTISAGGGKNALDHAVKHTIFQQLSLDKLPVLDDQGHPLTKTVNGKEHQIYASDFVEPLIERAERAVTNPATGWVALVVLLYGAITLMTDIESTFNHIYGAAKPRSWSHRIMLYWCVLSLGPLGAGASIALGHATYVKATNYVAGGHLGWLILPVQIISGVAISFVLVLLLFCIIPNTKVRWKSAIIGALLAAVLWEVCKWGFGVYVQRALGTSWYGSLALIPFFMLWIYLTWAAILIGLHVAYMHQYFPLLKRRYFFNRMGAQSLSDLRWVLSLGVLLYNRFKDGKITYVHDAAELLVLPNEVTIQMLEGLEMGGIVLSTRRGAYTLARPASEITAYDLLVAARSMCQVPPELLRENPTIAIFPQSPAMRDLETIEANWAKSRTLPELAGDVPHTRVESPVS